MTENLVKNIENANNIALNNIIELGNVNLNDNLKSKDFSNIISNLNAKSQKTQTNFVDMAVKSNTSSINKRVFDSSNNVKDTAKSLKKTESKTNVSTLKTEKNTSTVEIKNNKSNKISFENNTINEIKDNSNIAKITEDSKSSDFEKDNTNLIIDSSVEPSPVFLENEEQNTDVLDVIAEAIGIEIQPNQSNETKIDEFAEKLLSLDLSQDETNEVIDVISSNNDLTQEQKDSLINVFKNIIGQKSDNTENETKENLTFELNDNKEDVLEVKTDINLKSIDENETVLNNKTDFNPEDKKAFKDEIISILNKNKEQIDDTLNNDSNKDEQLKLANQNTKDELDIEIKNNIKDANLSKQDKNVILNNTEVKDNNDTDYVNKNNDTTDFSDLSKETVTDNLKTSVDKDSDVLSNGKDTENTENNIENSNKDSVLTVNTQTKENTQDTKAVENKNDDTTKETKVKENTDDNNDKVLKTDENKINSIDKNEKIDNNEVIKPDENILAQQAEYIKSNENNNLQSDDVSQKDAESNNFDNVNQLSKDFNQDINQGQNNFSKSDDTKYQDDTLELDSENKFNFEKSNETTSNDDKKVVTDNSTDKVDLENIEENLEKVAYTQEILDDMMISLEKVTSDSALTVADEVTKLALEENGSINSSKLQGQVVYDQTGHNITVKNLAFAKGQESIFSQIQQKLETSEILNQIGEKLTDLKNSVTQKLTMVLRPNDLGRLSIALSTNKDGLSTNIIAQNDDVRKYIEKNIDSLRKQLVDAGINVNNIQIKTAGQDGATNYGGNNERLTDEFNSQNQNKQNASKDNNQNQQNRSQNREFLAQMSNFDTGFSKDFSSILNKTISYGLN